MKLKQLPYSYLIFIFNFVPLSAYAEADRIRQEQEQQRFLRSGQQQWIRTLETPPAVKTETAQPDTNSPPVFSAQDLRGQADVLAAMLEQVLDARQHELLDELIGLYALTPTPDPLLLQRAQGMAAKHRGDYDEAVRIYRSLAAATPENTRIRLDLAAILAEDRQWRESEALFRQIRQEDIPPQVDTNIQGYLNAMQQQQAWQWSGGLSPAYDDNINNAAAPHCSVLGCSRESARSAFGLAYGLQAAKQQALAGHHGLLFQAQLGGTNYYLSRHAAQDSMYGRIGAGWLWQNADQRFTLLPFYQFQLSGTDNFATHKVQDNRTLRLYMWSHAYGLRAEYNRILSSRWQLNLAAEGYRQHYRLAGQAQRHDGWYTAQNALLARRATPRDTLYAGLMLHQAFPANRRLHGETNNAAYRRYGLQAGWIRDWTWPGGLSTRVSASAAERRFKGQALNVTAQGFPLERRLDREYQYGLALWHRDWAVWGMTPKLNLSRQEIRSSHTWAQRKNNQIFIELERRF
ncbi:MAG: porin family protein [Eikenella sp.]|nr:porin family protein [Eikenella sp.]